MRASFERCEKLASDGDIWHISGGVFILALLPLGLVFVLLIPSFSAAVRIVPGYFCGCLT